MEDYKILLKVNLVHPACFATLHFTSSPIKFPLSFLQPLFLSYSHLPPTWVSRTIQTSHRQSLITSKHRGHLFFFCLRPIPFLPRFRIHIPLPPGFMHFNADTYRGGDYFLSTANDNKRISSYCDTSKSWVLLIYILCQHIET